MMDVEEATPGDITSTEVTGNLCSGVRELGTVSPLQSLDRASEILNDSGEPSGMLGNDTPEKLLKVEQIKTEPGVTVKTEVEESATPVKHTSSGMVRFRIRLGSGASARGIKREREEEQDVTSQSFPQNKSTPPRVNSTPVTTENNLGKITCPIMDKQAIEALLKSGCPRVKLVRWNVWETTGQAKSPGLFPVSPSEQCRQSPASHPELSLQSPASHSENPQSPASHSEQSRQSPARHSEQSRQSPASRSLLFKGGDTNSLSTDNIENLIKTGSPSVKLVNPMRQRSQLWAGFKRIEYDGKLMNLASCRKCITVFRIDMKRATDALRKHKRICAMSQKNDSPVLSREAPSNDKNIGDNMPVAESSSEVQQSNPPIPNDQNSTLERRNHQDKTLEMPRLAPPTSLTDHADKSPMPRLAPPTSLIDNTDKSHMPGLAPPTSLIDNTDKSPMTGLAPPTSLIDNTDKSPMPGLAPPTSLIDHTDTSPMTGLAPPTSLTDQTDKILSVINENLSPDIFSNHGTRGYSGDSPSDSQSKCNSSFDLMQLLENPNASDSVTNDSYCASSSEQDVSTESLDSTESPCSDNSSVDLSSTFKASLSATLPSNNVKETHSNNKSTVCDPTAALTPTPTALPIERDHPNNLTSNTSDPPAKSCDVKDVEEMRKQVLDAAVAMCVKDLKPLSTCQGAGFKYFVHEMLKIVDPNCTLDTSTFVPDVSRAIRHLTLTYSKLKDKVKHDLCGCGQVAMRAEVRDNQLTLSASYISATWSMTSRVLATRQVEDETQLTAALNDTLQEFGLESSVCVWATTSATVVSRCPNPVRALTTIKQLPCAVQSLNRAVSQVLYSDQSDKADPTKALYPATTSQRDDVIGVLNAWEGLAHHCQTAGLKLALVEEYPRDWKSRLARLESFSENGKAMRVFLQDRDETFLRQENVDKHVLDDVIRLLQDFRRVTELLTKVDTPTLHLVLPAKVWLLQQCKQGLFDCTVIAKLKEGLRRGLETNLIIDPLHEVASSLHPQKKLLRYITKSQDRLDISNRVKEALSQLLACDVKADTGPPTKRRKVDHQGILDVFWSESDLNSEDDNIDLEVEQSYDVMTYWSSNYKKWPKLAAVARRVLAIPASAQPPSHWVSDHDKRTLLEPAALDQIVFLNYNMDR